MAIKVVKRNNPVKPDDILVEVWINLGEGDDIIWELLGLLITRMKYQEVTPKKWQKKVIYPFFK